MILCDAPCVRDVSALFGHGNKANRFHSTHGLPHVETLWARYKPDGCVTSRKFESIKKTLSPPIHKAPK